MKMYCIPSMFSTLCHIGLLSLVVAQDPTITRGPEETAVLLDPIRRQQQPFAVSDLTAQAVDTRYYSISSGTTLFVGSVCVEDTRYVGMTPPN
jgi:hypothetical protein